MCIALEMLPSAATKPEHAPAKRLSWESLAKASVSWDSSPGVAACGVKAPWPPEAAVDVAA